MANEFRIKNGFRSEGDSEVTGSLTVTGNANITNLKGNAGSGSFGITIDGGGSGFTTGLKGFTRIPYTGSITGWTMISDQSGSCVIDVWKANNAIPTVANSIAGTEKPTLTNQQLVSDTNLTTWTSSLSVGDIVAFNVDSISTVTRVNLIIHTSK
jgi:hypothetical protein